VGRGEPQVAGQSDEEPAADRVALQHRDGRLAHAGQAREHPGQSRFVGERVLARLEVEELTDVGAAREGPIARAAQHEHAHRRVGVERGARVVERLVHL